jgi:hypothetical protein
MKQAGSIFLIGAGSSLVVSGLGEMIDAHWPQGAILTGILVWLAVFLAIRSCWLPKD